MAMDNISFKIGQLQEAVDRLQEDNYKAQDGRQKLYGKLEEINLALQPIVRDMPAMRKGLSEYQTDKMTARRFIYAVTAIAATVGVSLSELKGWIIHLLK